MGKEWLAANGHTLKFKANGNLKRYKARLVAKRFTQIDGVDY